MKNVSQLSIIFRDKLHNLHEDSVENSDVVEKKPSDSSSDNNNIDRSTSWFASTSSSSFQMPLNYPNYTKQEYEIMSEEELDRLLKLYGLPIDLGDLSCKIQFVIGAFLWEKEISSSMADEHDSVNPNSSIGGDLDESSLIGLMTVMMRDMVHFIFRV
ncbi:unnamed protein product [Arabis nemorensis]|uniref:DUF7722 domain-containing protein n=1 Tax=Arabis nemorensis TaxID=586526 RepID=A0A565B6K6_9BRAS|nr:unnamed protein product [Arabis nemorensis]